MKSKQLRLGLLFVFVVLILSLLSLLFWDFVREAVIVPVYYLLWVVDLIFKTLPQAAFLAVLILISLVMGLNTIAMLWIKPGSARSKNREAQVTARYAFWRRLHTNLYSGVFARETFAWEARRLILAILADQTGAKVAEVEARIRNGTLPVPDTIRALIEQRAIRVSTPAPQRIENRFLRLRQVFFKVEPQRDPQLDSLVAEIITFIEHQLELDHAGNQPQTDH